MALKKLALQNFRNYESASFDFSHLTIIVGRNTIGKTNILEAIYFLSHLKSFRAEYDFDVIQFEKQICRTKGLIDDTILEVVLIKSNKNRLSKKYMINGVSKRKIDFATRFTTTLFTPQDIEMITGSPHLRRNYIDLILKQVDKTYVESRVIYDKALKARNKLLHMIKEGKKKYNIDEFKYWNNLLITNGNIITKQRENYINYVNDQVKHIFSFGILYDKSTITQARIDKYLEIEFQTGITLIGPQRDDFIFNIENTDKKVSEFSSRGEARLTVLQLKFFEIMFLKEKTKTNPLLLLDDIFSELDSENIERVLSFINDSQTIITTTHEEFIPNNILKIATVLRL